MSAAPRRFEPWAYGAFALALVTVALFLFLGLRPGGVWPVLAYRFGLLVLGWTAAVGMFLALLWCVRKRPLLQRRRAWPLCALGASLWLCSLPIAYPSSHEGKFSPTRFRLPFEGVAHVRQGGDRSTQNALRFDPARCYGTIFEALDDADLLVRSPVDATFVARSAGRGGERVVLQTGEREYCVLSGLARLASERAPGDTVRAGEALGSTGGPLTVHLQDEPVPGEGEGIPMRFFGYRADGRLAEAGVPVPPQAVEGLPLPEGAATGR